MQEMEISRKAVPHGHQSDNGTGIADLRQQAMSRDLPANPGPTADADIEDARKDGHGHRRGPHRDMTDEFRLERDVEQR